MPLDLALSGTDVQSYLDALATANRQGFGFLIGFGLSWLVAAAVWSRFGDRLGAVAALLQSIIATPLSLGLTAVAAPAERPDDPIMNELSIYLAAGQILALPLVLVLLMRAQYSTGVAVLAVVTAVHFVPYTWLYRTPIYVVVAVAVAVAVAILMGREPDASRREAPPPRRAGAWICGVTGTVLLLGGVAAFLF